MFYFIVSQYVTMLYMFYFIVSQYVTILYVLLYCQSICNYAICFTLLSVNM